MIKRLTKGNDPINYYEDAYSESKELREYLFRVSDSKEIDTDLDAFWSFSYRIVNESEGMVQVVNRDQTQTIL